MTTAKTSPSKRPTVTVAHYLTSCINSSGKSQAVIASECGFPKANMITMLKQGKTSLPFHRIGALAQSLSIDPLYLYKMAMIEYQPEVWDVIEPILTKQILLTENEIEIINLIRDSNVINPKIKSLKDKEVILEAINTLQSGD